MAEDARFRLVGWGSLVGRRRSEQRRYAQAWDRASALLDAVDQLDHPPAGAAPTASAPPNRTAELTHPTPTNGGAFLVTKLKAIEAAQEQLRQHSHEYARELEGSGATAARINALEDAFDSLRQRVVELMETQSLEHTSQDTRDPAVAGGPARELDAPDIEVNVTGPVPEELQASVPVRVGELRKVWMFDRTPIVVHVALRSHERYVRHSSETTFRANVEVQSGGVLRLGVGVAHSASVAFDIAWNDLRDRARRALQGLQAATSASSQDETESRSAGGESGFEISNAVVGIEGDVVDANGDKLGGIGQIYADDQTGEPTWVTVKTGLFGTSESFVPLASASVSGSDLVVDYDRDTIKDAPRVDTDGHLTPEEEEQLYAYYGLGGRTDSGPETADAMTRSEEQLRVGTQTREAGRARLRKYVVTENVTQTVPVTREEVRIERESITDVNRGEAATSGPDISGEEQEVVLHEEQPVVEKEAVPVERVRLDTETVTDQVTVSDEVRREELDTDVERATDSGVDNSADPGRTR